MKAVGEKDAKNDSDDLLTREPSWLEWMAFSRERTAYDILI
jgi:hypothetical protein